MANQIYTRNSKIGRLEYFFEDEIIANNRYLRVFFRLPGVIAPSAGLDAQAKHPGWFKGAIVKLDGRDGYLMSYFTPGDNQADRDAWAALGFEQSAARPYLYFDIDLPADVEAVVAGQFSPCDLRRGVNALADGRSRDYLLACLDNMDLEARLCEEGDDFYESNIDNVAWQFYRVRGGIDSAGHLAVRSRHRNAMDDALTLLEALRALRMYGPTIICRECGETGHWLDSSNALYGRGLTGYVYNLKEQYCGC